MRLRSFTLWEDTKPIRRGWVWASCSSLARQRLLQRPPIWCTEMLRVKQCMKPTPQMQSLRPLNRMSQQISAQGSHSMKPRQLLSVRLALSQGHRTASFSNQSPSRKLQANCSQRVYLQTSSFKRLHLSKTLNKEPLWLKRTSLIVLLPIVNLKVEKET